MPGHDDAFPAMPTLLTIREQDVVPEAPIVTNIHYETRLAARAVLLGPHNQVALLYASTLGYHKLPGGGVESGERIEESLRRELLEETGCEIKLISEVGQIIEYRDQRRLAQTSYCWLACQRSKPIAPRLTEQELAKGFQLQWAGTIDEAIATLDTDTPEQYDGKWMRLRDLTFLRAARTLLLNDSSPDNYQ